ncbi:MAG: hypothetical protein JWP52_4196, partial [Rhizobacter sp.]|nr:hypothetical protein [Rhizobacter sp.]
GNGPLCEQRTSQSARENACTSSNLRCHSSLAGRLPAPRITNHEALESSFGSRRSLCRVLCAALGRRHGRACSDIVGTLGLRGRTRAFGVGVSWRCVGCRGRLVPAPAGGAPVGDLRLRAHCRLWTYSMCDGRSSCKRLKTSPSPARSTPRRWARGWPRYAHSPRRAFSPTNSPVGCSTCDMDGRQRCNCGASSSSSRCVAPSWTSSYASRLPMCT